MRIHTAKDVGLAIRERRRQIGLDQNTLAQRAKVSRQWVVEVEKGKPRAEIELVLRTLQALGLDLSLQGATESSKDQADPLPAIDIDAILDDLQTIRRG